MRTGADNPVACLEFAFEIIRQRRSVVGGLLGRLARRLARQLVGDRGRRPDLTVGMGIAGAQHLAPVLKFVTVAKSDLAEGS